MIVGLAVLFRLFLRDRLLRESREQADRGVAGPIEGDGEHGGTTAGAGGAGTGFPAAGRRHSPGFCPPSHRTAVPVTYPAGSPARNVTSAPNSSAVP